MSAIGSNDLAILGNFARREVESRHATHVGRDPRPFLNMVKSMKKLCQFPGNGVEFLIKEPAYNINAQKWSGTDTLQEPQQIKNGLMATATPTNMFNNFGWNHDDIHKQCGVTIIPNATGGTTIDGRVIRRNRDNEKILFDRVVEDMESFRDRNSHAVDLELHRQGATAKDMVGLLAILSTQNTGLYCGLDRASVTAAQHTIYAGSVTPKVGTPWMDGRGIVGTNGNFFTQLEKFQRHLRNVASMSGLSGGRWMYLVGSGWLDLAKHHVRINGNWQINAGGSAESQINMLMSDERLGLGKDIDLELDYTLDQIDAFYPGEVGVAGSEVALAFTGGSATRQAKGVAYVNTAGQITGASILDPGEGYTSAPTCTITASSGSGGAILWDVFSASSGTGLSQVPADDSRIGRLAGVRVGGITAGSGYPTVGIAAPCTNRLYALYKPSWVYRVQEGRDNLYNIPTDNPRKRQLEQQWDHTHCLFNTCPRANGLFVAASA